MSVMWVVTGDPLWRRRQALAHVQIPSSELLGPVDPRHIPLLNPAYIANWRREPGLHIHWLIDGFLNLFINAKAGIFLGIAPPLLGVYRSALDERFKQTAWRVYTLALLYIASLIYVLAIDPKARMMYVPLSALALVVGAIVTRLARIGHYAIVAVVILAEAGTGLFILYIHPRIYPVEPTVERWIRNSPGKIEVDENTRRHLALVPAVETLNAPTGNKPFVMIKSDVNCTLWLRRSKESARLSLVRHISLSRGSLINARLSGELCLFRLVRPITGPEVSAARERAD